MDPVLVSMLGLFASALALLPAVWVFDRVEAWWDRRTARHAKAERDRTHPAE